MVDRIPAIQVANPKVLGYLEDLHRRGRDRALLGGVFVVEWLDPRGRVVDRDECHNLVTTVGLQDILDVAFEAGTQRTWYVGLTDGTPTVAAGDTMAAHAGWVEVVSYSEANRPLFNSTRTGSSTDNSASKAAFSINGATTTGGAFLSSSNTKGGATGILLCEVAFAGGDKTPGNGDTLNVTYTFTAADDGV